MSRKCQFTKGQVVALKIGSGIGIAYGEFQGITEDGKCRANIKFWDFDQADWWYWDYELSDVRKLNSHESEGK